MKTHRNILSAIAGIWVVMTFAAHAGSKSGNQGTNILDLLSLPAEKQPQVIRELAAKLAKSHMPTRRDAETAGLSAFHKIGLDMREGWEATGLFILGRDVPDFGAEGDLIWEITIYRTISQPAGVSGIVWVSAAKKTTKILFP